MATTSDDPAFTQARARFWRTRYELASEMIERAIARGELPRTADLRLALEALIAPLRFRALLTREPLDAQLPGQLANLVLHGLHASARTNQKPTRGDDRPFPTDGAAAGSRLDSAGSAATDGAEISPG